MRINRREFVIFATSVAIAPRADAESPSPSLAELARRKGMRFGSTIGTQPIGQNNTDFEDPAYRTLVQRECSLLVPENELKMEATFLGPDRFEFSGADKVVAFAETNRLAIRGHNLIWNDRFTPKWLLAHDFGSKPRVEAERLMRTYVHAIVERYGNRLTSWDIVNEAIDPMTGEFRSTVFTRILGRDTFRIAYEAARESLPNMQLVYNDFVSWAKLGNKHRDGVLSLLRGFRDAHVPVNALGVQSHLGGPFDGFDPDPNAWQAFLEAVTGMGYELVITELDVTDDGLPPGVAERDAKVAAYAKRYLDQMLAFHQVRDVVTWGLVDKYSWVGVFMPPADHLAPRPTLFDSKFRPKPFYDAVSSAFKAASAR